LEQLIKSYGERLEALIAERGPLCVGIDPHPSLLASWGLASNAAGLEQCARGMIEALGAIVPVFKPQSAFFEAYGAAGSAVLERTMADIKAAGALCILDVKRGDIGSTMDAYAAAYLSDGSPLAADAITVSPYLGFGTLDAAIELADQGGRGIYVLALTSNPEGPQVQHARAADGRTVGQLIVDEAASRNAVRRRADDRIHRNPVSSIALLISDSLIVAGNCNECVHSPKLLCGAPEAPSSCRYIRGGGEGSRVW